MAPCDLCLTSRPSYIQYFDPVLSWTTGAIRQIFLTTFTKGRGPSLVEDRSIDRGEGGSFLDGFLKVVVKGTD